MFHASLYEDVHTCVHVHVWGRIWTYICAHAYEDHIMTTGKFLYHLPPHFFWNWIFYEPEHFQLNNWTDHKSVQRLLSIFSQMFDCNYYTGLFTWVLGILTEVLMVVQKIFYQLCYFTAFNTLYIYSLFLFCFLVSSKPLCHWLNIVSNIFYHVISQFINFNSPLMTTFWEIISFC